MLRRPTIDAKLLGQLKTFAWLSRDQLEGLATSLEPLQVKRHDAIFREGETSDRVYVLLSGVAKLSFPSRDDDARRSAVPLGATNGRAGESPPNSVRERRIDTRRSAAKPSAEDGRVGEARPNSVREPRIDKVLVGLVGAGEIFGVSALLPGAIRPFRCEAFNDCLVGVTRPSTFVGLTLGVPLERFSRTLEVTVGRWWMMLQRYTNFVGLSVRDRLAGALLELAAKFGADDSRGVLLTLKLTHADLAELVGASRQRTTEQLIEFENQQLILRDGRRLIILPERLRESLRR